MTDKIIDKIKKCLALSSSSNEHEAAAALRQAQKLMAAHGISDLDLQAAEAAEKRSRAGAVKYPANWEAALADKIAEAFGCRLIFGRSVVDAATWVYAGDWVFIGTGAAPEIAAYAFEVLFRQAKVGRSEHIKSRLTRCKPANKTRRADIYCEGWVRAVTALITRFASGETHQAAIDAYVAKHYPALISTQSRDRIGDRLRPNETMDYVHGQRCGRDAQLSRGVDGAEAQKALS
jgi:hypothetical protein